MQHPPHEMETGLRADGRRRVVIKAVAPEIESGRFPIKRVIDEPVVVEADIFADGHEALSAVLLYRHERESEWTEVPLQFLVNDRWRGTFTVSALGRYRYTLQAWVERFASWRAELQKWVQAGADLEAALLAGAALVDAAAARAARDDQALLRAYAMSVRSGSEGAVEKALSVELATLMARHTDRSLQTNYPRELEIIVDRPRARFSTWYELFPRSWSATPGAHGTLDDVITRALPYVASMGFDVLYLSPIHPIGRTHRKGKNNDPVAGVDDVGSPWAIGGSEGGHGAIHPSLGTEEDFRRLVTKANEAGMEIALDVAFQCSPDHPYVHEHPEWFRKRPDGSIQYAENPPKKYEDIYPLDFETAHWSALWEELKRVVLYWVGLGVRIFRVDNPHTKPFAFWEWLIGEIKRDHPDVIFLSEAFTRPKVMYHLSKAGFTQSYTYFAWRNTRGELTDYFTELTQTELREFFRPHLWPNTPDILTEYLQLGGRPAFMARLVLAATLGAGYGIYGPAFELIEHTPRDPGREEYLNSEKYEVRRWDLERADSLAGFIARVNRIRRENTALQSDWSLRFHHADNEQLIVYSKSTPERENVIVTVVNLDPHYTQSGWVDLALEDLGLDPQQSYQMHDLLTDAQYLWQGRRNYVELNPRGVPAHIFRLRRRVRTERDFEYFM